jgi:hypothetical protein
VVRSGPVSRILLLSDCKRYSKRAGEEETEHAAEEAEMRTKVPWEPDGGL